MSNDRKDGPLKVVFAPGCFDHLDVTQEELDELMVELEAKFNNVTKEELAAMSRPLTDEDFDAMPDEIKAQLENFGEGRNLQ